MGFRTLACRQSCLLTAVFLCLSAHTICGQQNPELPSSLEILMAAESQTISVVEQAEKSVVAIARVPKKRMPVNRASFNPATPPRSFGSATSPLDDPDFVPQFFGSGLILSEDGFIVTCAHVLENPRENDYYVWSKNRAYRAKLIGRPGKVYASDPFSDLAVLKIEANGLPPARFAKKLALRKGQFVIALGNPDAIAADGEASASWGIISNLTRLAPRESNDVMDDNMVSLHQYGTLIQTDAKLSLGSSGGALVNLKGEVIGLTTSLASGAGFDDAAGFAIATDQLFRRVTDSLKQGRLPEYGFLGIQPDDLFPEEKQNTSGAKISLVFPGWPGDEAGLEEEDIITQVGETKINGRRDLFRELSMIPPGQDVELDVLRQGVFGRRNVRLTAKLSKKFVVNQQGYAINSPPAWRGMSVEYSTALSPSRSRLGSIFDEHQPAVSVLSVVPGSPTWNAGIRPGTAIVSVERNVIATPEEFRSIVAKTNGAVEMLVLNNGSSASITITQN